MNTPKLTKIEREVYTLYTVERLTPTQIALRLKKTPQTVRVHLYNLRKKGFFTGASDENTITRGAVVKSVKKIGDLRLDGMQWKIKILGRDRKYARVLEEGNIIPDFKGQYVVLYEHMIEVYGKKEFHGPDSDTVTFEASEWWVWWARQLENRLGVTIIKNGYQNWKLVKHGEYAREGSSIAQSWIEGLERHAIRSPRDGRIFYWVDWSKSQPEDEAGHPVSAKIDREEIDRHYTAWHTRPGCMTTTELEDSLKVQDRTVRELRELLTAQVRNNTVTAAQVNALATSLQIIVNTLKPSENPEAEPLQKRPDYFG